MKPFTVMRARRDSFMVLDRKDKIVGLYKTEEAALEEAGRLNGVWADGYAAGELGVITKFAGR